MVTDTVAATWAELCTGDGNTVCTTDGVLPDDSWTFFAPTLGMG